MGTDIIDEDEVLRGFQRYVPHPTAEDVAWWVRAFPHYADAIRAREVIDIQALAGLAAREEDVTPPIPQRDGRNAI